MAKPLVSVIVPTFNRQSSLKRTVQSVLKQTYKNFELIVVDDTSTDGTTEYMQSLKSKKVKYIKNKKNKGSAFSRNAGIAKSKGSIIAFLDDDCEAHKNWLSDLVPELLKTQKDVAGVCGLVYPPKKASSLAHAAYYLPGMDENTLECLENDTPFGVKNISCTNAVWKKSVLKKVGHFDVKQIRGQDSELCYRARKKGFRFLMYKKGKMTHHYRTSLTAFVQWAYKTGKGSALTYLDDRDYLKDIQIFIYSFPIILVFALYHPGALFIPLLFCTAGIRSWKREKSIGLFVTVTFLQFIKAYANLIGMWKVLITRKY